jgi:hypothetical protein
MEKDPDLRQDDPDQTLLFRSVNYILIFLIHADVYQHLSLSTVVEKDPDRRQGDIDKFLLFRSSGRFL